MKNFEKYKKNYFVAPKTEMRWAKKDHIETAPIWCSVDLRDGNQALVVPMSLDEKVEFFNFLVELGFKEIEVGFPAASETEFLFLRTLIEKNLIPSDVTIQVLTQAREHIIKKTFESLRGTKQAIVHLYNSTSVAQREQVFKKSKKEIIDIAVNGAELLKKYADETVGNFRFQYSPESFTGTEMEFALEICNSVLDVWKPTIDNKVIINLPVTVQLSMPHVYANQIEYMCDNLKYRDSVIVSTHPHNDRGCGVADTEMALLAGAERVEGTLFGNGERTGNVDLVTVALNMYSQGVNPKLSLENIPYVVDTYERLTDMTVNVRQPYSGKLVFAAFSGSHQDAIAKGMQWREEKECDKWDIPYLPIDPKDIGREYESDVIRINSQSGKGGIGYLIQKTYGLDLPPKMREDFGYAVKNVSDHLHKELLPSEIYEIFMQNYVNVEEPIKLVESHYNQGEYITANVTIETDGERKVLTGKGNGRLDAVNKAFANYFSSEFKVENYNEHSLEIGSQAQAVAYIGILDKNGDKVWGAGIDTDIINASIKALISAINRRKA